MQIPVQPDYEGRSFLFRKKWLPQACCFALPHESCLQEVIGNNTSYTIYFIIYSNRSSHYLLLRLQTGVHKNVDGANNFWSQAVVEVNKF